MPASSCTKHYIFGYGSLICSQSRAITAPTLASKPAHPIMARHVERTWTARDRTMTFMGVRFREGASCAGVLLPVNEKELAKFDVREEGYDRIYLTLQQLEKVPFLSDNDGHDVLSNKDARVWIYVHKCPIPANPSFPIVQSYVDIILRGCLSISNEFAASFLETTQGWHHDGDDNAIADHYTWVDDRHCPLYVRADPHYSRSMAATIDDLLQKHVQDAWRKRRRYAATI